MRVSVKLKEWEKQGFISKKQAEKIMQFEQSNNSNIVWKWMYGVAGFFIGLGCILLISANWDAIPSFIKIFMNFAILGSIFYAAYWSIINEKNKLKELFLTLSFLGVGATIGLIGQIFNLNGGWSSFVMVWSILGFPFVILSRLFILNLGWICLFIMSFSQYYDWLLEYILFRMHEDLGGPFYVILFFALLSYICKKIDIFTNKYTIFFRVFYILFLFKMYLSVIALNFFGFRPSEVHSFTFVFFGIRLFLAVRAQNMLSFKRNAIATEFYVFYVFITIFRNLFMSGLGFILGGMLILAFIYLLRVTSKCIKEMKVFHE